MPETIERLRERGQSIWLDFIHRGMLDSGQLERYVREGWITGLTSNPTIFNRAISGSARYDDALREAAEEGAQNAYEAFVRIASDDLRRAADLFRGVYEQTGGADGYVSFEAPPGIEHDAEATVREAHRLREAVGRPNVMIKVPGTTAGVDALRELTAHGASVNVTLLFGVGVYERVATAYIEGLERRLEQGLPLGDVASVASFFVSRVDSKVDGWLPGGSELLGRAAVANASGITSAGRAGSGSPPRARACSARSGRRRARRTPPTRTCSTSTSSSPPTPSTPSRSPRSWPSPTTGARRAGSTSARWRRPAT